jgi:proline iminopeptidase
MLALKKSFIHLPDVDLCFESLGTGSPILIIGGSLGGGSEYMYPLMEEISKDYHVFLLHQRGTGESKLKQISAESLSLQSLTSDIDAFRNHLKLDQLNILAHSWGGMLACAYLDQYPEKVSSMILVNSMGLSTAAFAYLIDNITQRHSGADLDKLKYLIRQNQTSKDFDKSYRQFFKFAQTSYFFDKSLAQSFQKNLSPSFFSLPVYRLILEDLVKSRFDLRNVFLETNVNVSMIWSRQDILGAQPLIELYKAFPKINARVIERSGHYPWFEQKDKFYEILNGFLKVIQ